MKDNTTQWLKNRWRLFQHRRMARRAAVSKWAAQAHRSQTERVLQKYPEAEPMPSGEWFREIALHLRISFRARFEYRRSDVLAVIDALS